MVRFPAEPTDSLPPDVRHAVEVVFRSFGDAVSVERKGKQLRKFGQTTNADDGVKTTIAEFGNVSTPNVNETFETTNAIDAIVSSSASDTMEVTIEGHTIDGSGNLTFVVQNVTLTGQTPATLTTPLARATRIFVTDQTFGNEPDENVGRVVVFASDGVTVTSGVPQTNTAVKCVMNAATNQSRKCATSISQFDYWFITQIGAAIDRSGGTGTAAEIELEVRRIGGVFRPQGVNVQIRRDAQQQVLLDISPPIIVRPNSDVRLIAIATTDNTTIEGFINGYLGTTEK